MEIFLLAGLFLSAYSYIFFPMLLHALAKTMARSWKTGDVHPRVSIIISAYNEEKDIGAKLANSLALKYPLDKIEIIVSSDGSNDATNDIVAAVDDDRIILKAFSERLGKTACLNRVVPEAGGDILVFTDANSMFPEDSLEQMVKNFHDEEVGCVTGWTKYRNSATGEETTGIYARLEKKTKEDECAISSCVGADGAIFAIRKELYRPLGANDINDFIIPLNVVRQGRRVVLDPDVFCIEEETVGTGNIFKRQVRITTRTAWALRRNMGLLNAFRYGSFSFFLLSHKVLRLLTPVFLLATFVFTITLFGSAPIYQALLAAELLGLGFALGALAGIFRGRAASICKYLLVTMSAHFLGCLRMAAGIEDVMWTPKR